MPIGKSLYIERDAGNATMCSGTLQSLLQEKDTIQYVTRHLASCTEFPKIQNMPVAWLLPIYRSTAAYDTMKIPQIDV